METRTRWTVLWFLVLISVVRSMDAVNFSVAAKQLMPEYGFSNVQMGALYTVFTAGYALFHLPGGWLGDTLGPRRMLTAAVLWWSAFTGLTAVAGDWWVADLYGPLASFMVVRFLVGVGEGAAYPNSTRAVASWMAAGERALASGLVMAGVGIGYGLAPPVVSWIMVHYGWRPAFYVFALAGVVLAVCWHRFATDSPETHPRVSAQELRHIRGGGERMEKRPTPWRAIFTHPNVWLLMLANFGFGYGIYIFQSWFYLYLVNVRGFSLLQGGVLTTGPFLALTVLGPLGGLCSDALARRYGVTWGRRLVAVTGFLLAALCLYAGAGAADPYLAVVLLSLGDGFLYFAGAATWGATIDIAGPHSGTVYGVTVTVLQIGGAVAPTLTPVIADRFGWEAALYVAGLLALVSAFVWMLIDAQKRIVAFGAEPERVEQLVIAR
jgi:ACS family glucarate transporter-like MFS transporter